MQDRQQPFRILHLCTANLCRSQLAAGFTRRAFERVPGARKRFVVTSGGTHAVDGLSPDPLTLMVAAESGLDLGNARSHRLVDADTQAASLVLTATRDQRGIVLAEVPDAVGRTFTLLEFADLVGMPEVSAAASPDDLVVRAAQYRGACRLDDLDHLDLTDPIGGALDAHRTTAGLIGTAVQRVVSALMKT